eukprot:1143207-Pelagomonas_calceolata.AAC.6
MQGQCQPWQPIPCSSAAQVQSRIIGSSRHLTQPQEAFQGGEQGKPAAPLLTVAANKPLSAHAKTAAAERDWSACGRMYTSLHNLLSIETADTVCEGKHAQEVV